MLLKTQIASKKLKSFLWIYKTKKLKQKIKIRL